MGRENLVQLAFGLHDLACRDFDVRGLSLRTAQRLVDRFGADTLAVIEEEPERLQTVKGITAKKAMELSAAFRELTGLKRVMEFLARYELPVPLAMQLYRAYGAQALPRLKEDPYLLTGQAYGVAFSTMDEIALSMGFDGDSPCRVEAALTYELSHNLNNGHVFLPRPKLLAATEQLIGAPPELVEQALEGENTALPTFVEARNQFELNYLRKLLQITKGNVTHAARMAGRNRTEFYKLLSRHELDANDFKE